MDHCSMFVVWLALVIWMGVISTQINSSHAYQGPLSPGLRDYHQLTGTSPLFNSLNNSNNQLLLSLYYNASSASTLRQQQQQQHQNHEREQSAHQAAHATPALANQDKAGREVALVKSLIRNGFDHEEEAPLITSSFNAEDERHLAAAHLAFYMTDTLTGVLSVADWLKTGLIALTESAVYHNFYVHRYDNFEDLKRASGPAVNNEKCIEQLTDLAKRAEDHMHEKYYSRDSNLYGLLDTWGHVDSGVFTGRLFFEGAYNECVRYKIRKLPTAAERARGEIMSAHAPIETRYCVLSLQHQSWQRVDKHNILNMKSSVCIPKSCDSSNYKNKLELIGRIAQTQVRRIEEGQWRINNMFCMPDEDSPLRSIRDSPKAVLAASLFGAWILFLVFATWRYDKLKRLVDQSEAQSGSGFGLTNMNIDETKSERVAEMREIKDAKLETQRAQLKVFKLLSITNNLRLLFDTTKESSLLEAAASKPGSTKPGDQSRPQAQPIGAPAASMKFVDLRCIEGIKVIAMCYVIMGHVLMCLPAILSNGRELAGPGSYAFFLANLVPAFAVNSFFTITGLLTCYLMFKQNKSQPVIRSPGKWVAFIVYRYLRIMPMYALVVFYCKTLAKYTGSGPFWDYGTSSLGQRATCEQEPWHWTLLFISNFLPPMQHCIPGGWYLSNDFQFFLVTPFLVMTLERSPKWGKRVLKTLTFTGYALGFYSIYASPIDDLRPIAIFSPHGFKTYVSHFSFNYTYPQYRIMAYFIGLLVGYKLFEYEEEKKRFYEKQQQKQQQQQLREVEDGQASAETCGSEQPPDWSAEFKWRAAFCSAFFVLLSCMTPFIGSSLNPTKWAARVLVAGFTPTCHVQFSAAVGMYIMLATTGNGNKYITRLLAASWWKPLARLSLCAVLVNVEVINYIIQTNTSQHYISNQYHTMLNMLCIVCTYLMATVVCVLFEAPIRASLNAILTNVIARVAKKQKTN